MPTTMPPKRPAGNKGPGAVGLHCPTCDGDDFAEQSSFKTASEPLLGGVSASVIVDLMSCRRCGAALPSVRGRSRYSLIGEEKLSALVAELNEAKRANLGLQGQLDAMESKSKGLRAEIERCRAEGEVSVIEVRVAALEAETDGLEGMRARLAATLELMAPRAPRA